MAATTYSYISRPSRKAGYSGLVEGGKVTFDIVDNRGKQAAENLRVK
jgi:cold shock CspA family protein